MNELKRWLRSIALVFSTYTRIPVPKVKWDGGALTLAIAFLPLCGAAAGLAFWAWLTLCRLFGVSPVLFAAVATALPIAVSGGIHMDGYCDTSDALAAQQDTERSLFILKDPHIGAFALIRVCVYLMVEFSLFYELFILRPQWEAGLSLMFVLSRGGAALQAITLRGARKDGMFVSFTKEADRRKVSAILITLTAAGIAGWLLIIFPPLGLAGLALCLVIAVWYRYAVKKRFGGATGDTTGYYLQLNELALLSGAVLADIVANRTVIF